MDRQEWLLSRHQGIGSSEAAALHGLSPYMKYEELYQEKCRATPTDNGSSFIQQRGQAMEPRLRAYFAMNYFVEKFIDDPFESANVVHHRYSYMRASLDGLSKDKTVFIECKLVGKKVYEAGIIPIAYFCQMQHQYACSNALEGYMVMGEGDRMKSFLVPRDESFIIIHKRRCKEFWKEVLAYREINKLHPIDEAKRLGL